jgi:hypothetical protein
MNDRRLAPSPFHPIGYLPRRLLVIAALTIAANELFRRHRVGISLPIYACLLCLGIITSARRLGNLRWFWFSVALLAGSILAGANATSFSNFVSMSVILTVLFGICFYRARRVNRSISRAVLSFGGTPFRWLRVALVTYRLYLAKGRHKLGWKLLQQTVVVSFAAAVPIFVVSCCLVSGNLILGTWFSSFIDNLFQMLRNFSPVHWLFLAFFATVALGFVWPGRGRIRPPLPVSSQLSLPGFASPVWINGMRLTLWLMNALFLLANTVDALFLWLRSRPPAGVTYSDFVHHGTNSLIFATIWSALIIVLIVECFSKYARDLRLAALIWIGQNIVLIFGVFRRLKLYVDAYNLTVLRLDVALFLLVVLTGFLLLAVYILQRRTFGWLSGSGCIALFSLFYILQFCDLGAFVASYDVDRWIHPGTHTQADVYYLKDLGPGAWSSLQRLSESDSRFALLAQLVLTRIRANILLQSSERQHWQSFQFRRYLGEARLLQPHSH